MTAKLLDQIGLIFGFISGLLLIPEIFILLPLERIEKSIENQLARFENWTRFPLRFSPPSWKIRYTESQREAVEPLTAIRSLIFSIVWIALLAIGIRLPSIALVLLSLIILAVVVIGNMMKHARIIPLKLHAENINIPWRIFYNCTNHTNHFVSKSCLFNLASNSCRRT